MINFLVAIKNSNLDLASNFIFVRHIVKSHPIHLTHVELASSFVCFSSRLECLSSYHQSNLYRFPSLQLSYNLHI